MDGTTSIGYNYPLLNRILGTINIPEPRGQSLTYTQKEYLHLNVD